MRKLLILAALAWVSLGVTCFNTTSVFPAIAPCDPSFDLCGPTIITPVVPVVPVGCDPTVDPACGGIPVCDPTMDPTC